jgi:hypothetical protein
MDISLTHQAAREAASRIPALNASLALLDANNPDAAHLDLYPAPRPDAGEIPAGALVVSIPVSATAGTVDEGAFELNLTGPMEGLITGADPATGTTVTWGRWIDGNGDWFADVSVSDSEPGSVGEVKLQSILLFNGAYARLTSAKFSG